jgi:DNA helicase-2/ATP-dependent DNA helicase PcrA
VDVEGFGRIINVPPRGIGDVTLAKILDKKTHELSPAMREKLSDFMRILDDIKKKSEEVTAAELVKFVMKRSGLESSALAAGEDERVENMQELVTLATKYDLMPPREGVQKLMEDAALASDQDDLIEAKNGVRLMTVHAAKGLEFRHVFVVGLEQDLFPHRKMDDSSDPEEERRLFYVAITRAREKLHLSYAVSRTIFGSRQFNMPSEFLADISPELIDQAIKSENRGSFFSDFGHQGDDEETIQWGALSKFIK